MRQHIVFMNRDGVRIDDQWVDIRGRRMPLADLRDVFIVDEPADFGIATIAATAIAASALIGVMLATAVPVRVGAATAIFAALVVMIAIRASRPRRVSLWVSRLGNEEILLKSAQATFVNQVVRALVRASAGTVAGRPMVYRVAGRRPRLGSVALGVLAIAAGMSSLVLTMCNPTALHLLGQSYW